jgi:translation initiation factor eIF-2B subunit epsilon
MTMVLKPVDPYHRTRERCEGGVFAIDGSSNQLLHYEQIESETSHGKISIPTEILATRDAIQVRYDLADCNIDVCSLEVLALFTENFDYQDMRKDFLNGVLNSEIFGHTIYCNIVEDDYVARVRSMHLYDSVSRDILARWTFPLVPESNIMATNLFHVSKNKIYKDSNVLLSR